MKSIVNEGAIRETTSPGQTAKPATLPIKWKVTEWNAELFTGLPGRNSRPRLIDCELLNYSKENSELSVRLFDPDPAVVYSIDMVERLAQTPRRTILRYCRHGLVSPVTDSELGGYYFNRQAILILQRIAYLQTIRGVNLAGVKFILNLMEEIQRLRETPGPDSSTNPKVSLLTKE